MIIVKLRPKSAPLPSCRQSHPLQRPGSGCCVLLRGDDATVTMTPRGAAIVLLELTWTGDYIRRLNTTLDQPHYAQIMPIIAVALIHFFSI